MILKKIKQNLASHIKIDFFSIHNDSMSHNYSKNDLTHLKIIIISNDFINKNWVTRHRMIFSILQKTIPQKIYSLTLYTYTVKEWKNTKKSNLTVVQCMRKKIQHNVISNL